MKENFKKKVLKNGMTVIFEKRDVPVVSLAFVVKQGGIHEDLEEKGISHFIEHMLYKGTNTRNSRQISFEIEKNGGILNGFTGDELTAFWCKLPSDKLNVGLEVLTDILKNSIFEEKEIEKERKVIFEEMDLYKDNPRLYIFNEIQKCLYGGNLSVDLIGTKETMGKVDREKMVKKFEEVYVSENMFLCLVGDANFENLLDFCEKNFLPRKAIVNSPKIIKKNEIKVEERKGVDQANLVLAYHVPILGEKNNFASKVLGYLMAEGMSSRLFSEIREKRNLAYGVKQGHESNKNFAYNWIYVGTRKENVEEVKKLILEEFLKVSKELDEKELDEVKQQILGNYKISMEESVSQMEALLHCEIVSKAEDFYDFENNISNVTLEEVKELASIVREGNYSFFALIPEEK
jgi:predicted Zn-dependent peptidase